MIHDPSCTKADDPVPFAAMRERAPRTNLFLSAMIEAGDAQAPVRIRNLSETGAMVEGVAFPAIGAPLKLHRLDVDIDAHMVWQAGSRAGLQFAGKVAVAEWVAGKRSAANPAFGQLRVDTIQAAIRTRTALPSLPELAPATRNIPDAAELNRRLAEEIALVRRTLETMGDAMTDDTIVVQRHHKLLQNFDLSCQILDHLARIIVADDRQAAVADVGMDELRARLMRGRHAL